MQPCWSEEERTLLARTPLFQGLSENWILKAAEDPACGREAYEKGAVIYSPRRFRRCLGLFLSGGARVTKGTLVVSALERGDLFGAAALFHQRERYETTITARNPSTVAFFPEALVAALLAECPGFRLNYIRYLSERIHFLNRKIEGFTAPGAVGRLSRYLLEEGGGGRAACAATELARRLDVSRASLYRAFEELEEAGAIRREGRTIVILNPKALESDLKLGE